MVRSLVHDREQHPSNAAGVGKLKAVHGFHWTRDAVCSSVFSNQIHLCET